MSEHAACACAAITAAAKSADVEIEVQLAPPDHGLVVAISHEGGTTSTLPTTAAAPRAVLITAQPGGEGEGVLAVATPRHDKSWCHTLAYTPRRCSRVALALEALTAEAAEQAIAAELAARPARHADAERLAGAARLLAVISSSRSPPPAAARPRPAARRPRAGPAARRAPRRWRAPRPRPSAPRARARPRASARCRRACGTTTCRAAAWPRRARPRPRRPAGP